MSDTLDEKPERRFDAGSNPAPAAPSGLHRADSRGEDWLDAMAGRHGPRGYGFDRWTAAVQTALRGLVSPPLESPESDTDGDATAPGTARLVELLSEHGLRTAEAAQLTESRDAAIEAVVLAARRIGAPDRYRTVALVDSDHGRSMLCRTLSGRPELQAHLGPLVAGFAHVTTGDVDMMRRTVDEQTVAVVVSPIALHDAAKRLDATFLKKLRERCDEVGALLVADESAVSFGCCGAPLATATIADVEVDAAIFAAGLFGGLSGGVVVGSRGLIEAIEIGAANHSLLEAALSASLSEIGDAASIASAAEVHQEFAGALAKRLSGFEFIRDVHAHGGSIGIELDVPASEWIEAAATQRLLLESAGEYAVWVQLPLLLEASEYQQLLTRLGASLEAVERLTTLAGV